MQEDNAQTIDMLHDELSSFANSASHDLKAPLASISGLLQLCIEDIDENHLEEARANLLKALEISARSARKVENVLAIARAGRGSLAKEVFRLDKEIHEVWQDLTAAAPNAAELRLKFEHKEPVLAEHPTINVILQNLLSNALRYCDPEKANHWVSVTTRQSGGTLEIEVADNGMGIKAQNLDRIFNIFDRIDQRSGDGLGLALVRKHLGRLGGRISVASNWREGAEFTVRLPVDGCDE